MQGQALGAHRPVGGEVVFNTGMTGYVETLTDPSYKGQILVMTYPLVGNYGVPASRAVGSIERPFESGGIQVQGLVVQRYVEQQSRHAASRSFGAWLQTNRFDTRVAICESSQSMSGLIPSRWRKCRDKARTRST